MTVDIDPALELARQQLFATHRADPNFTGCGIGFRRRAGMVTDELALVAMVVKKRPEAVVSRYRLLPRTVEVAGRSWGVDVVEAGPVAFSAQHAAPRMARRTANTPITQLFRPPVQGCSISNLNGGAAGTLGCFATGKDGTVYVVSTSHVMAVDGTAKDGQLIIQPAVADSGTQVDGIASLSYAVPFGTGTNKVDAAIAQLTDQADYSTGVADDIMAPISPTHEAVGMVVADDWAQCGTNCFLSRMDNTASELGVTLVAATKSSSAIATPVLNMKIEKVGRASGYSSSVIDWVNVTVKVQYSGGVVTLSDMLWTQAFSMPGDSGAVACVGGNGATYVPPSQECTGGTCPLADAIAKYYNVPVDTNANLTVAYNIRDNFLAMSSTGQLLIGLTYLNAPTGINRLQSRTGAAHRQSVAQARAESLYSLYHSLVAKLARSPSPTAVVTSSEVSLVASVLFGLTAPVSAGGTDMLTSAESDAAWNLYSDIVQPTVGMGRQQLIDYMNESTVYQRVFDQLKAVPTIKINGTDPAG